jgi:hypothetical protein
MIFYASEIREPRVKRGELQIYTTAGLAKENITGAAEMPASGR